MQIFNSLTGKKEEFEPIDKNNVRMYACGITCSDDAHIGHAKQALQFDVMRRYLTYKGYNVTYVRNHTDVDDKIIANANKIGMDQLQYARKYIERINTDLSSLGIRKADYEPKASETIQDIIDFIQDLICKGYAYQSEVNGDVYFDVLKFPEYGKLSNRDVEEQLDGVRKNVLEGKHDNRDFALWKSAKEGEVCWDSPWGKGRPGWHIECSAMCGKFLGKTIDIHGGGRDLKFPHHENEIAQSEAKNGMPLAKYWVHCGLVKVEGQKMSKSLGNGIKIRDVLQKYNAEVVKLVILQSAYRSDLNIMPNDFEQAEKHLYEFYKVLNDLKNLNLPNEDSSFAKRVKNEFVLAMDDDFNTTKAIANMYDYIAEIRKNIQKKNTQELNGVYQAVLSTYGEVLSLFNANPCDFVQEIKDKYFKLLNIDEQQVDSIMKQRAEYKLAKDYAKADECKNKIIGMGLTVVDTVNGSYCDIDWNLNK